MPAKRSQGPNLFKIVCPSCGQEAKGLTIEDIVQKHRDPKGWIVCPACGQEAYIPIQKTLAEGDEWKPHVRAIITFWNDKSPSIYRPFAFAISYEPKGKIVGLWMNYYKVLPDEQTGGTRITRIKHGPALYEENLAYFLPRLTELLR
ncbi:hypothetical protein [Thermus oshimai]|uniref:hypothetical protein n=1 Tax=Thermus oshimai TaxID=56957 RepID=UPI0012DE1A01|nr:hypothetical protein [Thermus oshimai]